MTTHADPSPALVAYVRSRIPMVEHDFHVAPAEGAPEARHQSFTGRYSLQQAFFYQCEWWVNKAPLVSEAALAHAREHWGDDAERIWTLLRAEIPKVEGTPIAAAGLINEHVFTGSMFREGLLWRLKTRQGTLDAYEVACWLQANFQTAWITRQEDRALSAKGYKSKRGETLEDALACYSKTGIALASRPMNGPQVEPQTVADVVVAEEDDSSEAGPRAGVLAGAYDTFFAELGVQMQRLGLPPAKRGADSGRLYGVLYNGTADRPSVWVGLVGPRGQRVRCPVVFLEMPSQQAGREPDRPIWQDLRATLGDDGWVVSYGRHSGQADRLCRCSRRIGDSFVAGDPDQEALSEAARQAAVNIAEYLGFLAP